MRTDRTTAPRLCRRDASENCGAHRSSRACCTYPYPYPYPYTYTYTFTFTYTYAYTYAYTYTYTYTPGTGEHATFMCAHCAQLLHAVVVIRDVYAFSTSLHDGNAKLSLSLRDQHRSGVDGASNLMVP